MSLENSQNQNVSVTENSPVASNPAASQAEQNINTTSNVGANQEHTPAWITILTIILLLTFTLVGVIVMWTSTKWPKAVKWTITTIFVFVPFVLLILGVLAVAVLSSINPAKQIARGRDTARQSDAMTLFNAAEEYYAKEGFYPEGQEKLVAEGYLKDVLIDRQSGLPLEYRLTSNGTDCEIIVPSETAKKNIVITCLDPDFSDIVSVSTSE